MGQSGIWQIVKATVIGIPLPLCSCGVIPVAAGLYRQGASRGATTAFLASTPQTGVDSIAANLALMGPIFTTIRVIVAFISGIITGLLIELFDNSEVKITKATTSSAPAPKRTLKEGLYFGLVGLPKDIAKAVLIGIVIAGITSALVPEDFFTQHLQNQWLVYLTITVVSVPLYVCSTASIPLAFALINAGISPGAALILLIAGPATNAATISTLWKLMSPRTVLIYVSSIIVVSWISATLFDRFYSPSIIKGLMLDTHHHHAHIMGHIAGIILLGVFIHAVYSKAPHDHSHEHDDSCGHDHDHSHEHDDSCGHDHDHAHDDSCSHDHEESISFYVKAMSCENCERHINETLMDLPNVNAVTIDLSSKKVYVKGSHLDQEKLEAALRKAGY